MNTLREVFTTILNMNVAIALVILFVLMIRFLMKKVPMKYHMALWLIVAFRMISPFSFSSIFSMFPAGETRQAQLVFLADSARSVPTTSLVTNASQNQPVLGEITPEQPIESLLTIGALIWITGCLIAILYGVYCYHKLKVQLATAVRKKENIFYSDQITSPFVFGILRPRIYMPYHLSTLHETYIIQHEKMHIQRGDHITKQIAYYLNCIHWFNPCVWIGYHYFEKDIEMACDEAVIKTIGYYQKSAYSETLLHMAMHNHRPIYAPLSFGETGVKERIHHILSYRKPKLIISIIICTVLCVACVSLISNPPTNSPTEAGTSMREEGRKLREYLDISIDDTEKVDELLKMLNHPGNADFTWERSPDIYHGGNMNHGISITYTNLDRDYVDKNWYAVQSLMRDNVYFLSMIMKDLYGVTYKDNTGMLEYVVGTISTTSSDDLETRIDTIDHGKPDIEDYDFSYDILKGLPYTIDQELIEKEGFHVLKNDNLPKEVFSEFMDHVKQHEDASILFLRYTEHNDPILYELTYRYDKAHTSVGIDRFDYSVDTTRDTQETSFLSTGTLFTGIKIVEEKGIDMVYLVRNETYEEELPDLPIDEYASKKFLFSLQ